eukprot:TRINITY_DN33124_c0_g1_i1.p1 TRINITY_DN33124_c0_g1~~TRINITY_DN33124_c0_g1_i1.p1  ORF type:complete len:935 (+),score=59.82 TRINITY_DN33124_c0_g1_i1:99-2903(+)
MVSTGDEDCLESAMDFVIPIKSSVSNVDPKGTVPVTPHDFGVPGSVLDSTGVASPRVSDVLNGPLQQFAQAQCRDVDHSVAHATDHKTSSSSSSKDSGVDSSVVEDHKLDVDEIRARTMFRMVQEVTLSNSSSKKVLFLTNKQASLVASAEDGARRLLDAFELPRPKLIIWIMQSSGGEGLIVGKNKVSIPENFPYLNGQEDHLKARQKYVAFFDQVIIPLACETNALIYLTATLGSCCLANAFNVALSMVQSRWNGRPPFTTLGTCCGLDTLYTNEDLTANWREFSGLVRNWHERHNLPLPHLDEAAKLAGCAHDLDTSLENYIICDGVNDRDNAYDHRPFQALSAALIKELTQSVPCIAFKAGSTNMQLGDDASLGMVLSAVQHDFPTVLLDARHWELDVNCTNRSEIIEQGKQTYKEFCTLLGERGAFDSLDVSAVIFFATKVLGLCYKKRKTSQTRVPLHEAISQKQKKDRHMSDSSDKLPQDVPPASLSQVQDVLRWWSHTYYEHMWAHFSATGQPQAADYIEQYGRIEIHDRAMKYTKLITCPNVYMIDISEDSHDARQTIQDLVCMDRLPKEECIQGLQLIRECWDEYDAKVYLSNRYKIFSKRALLISLTLGVIITSLSSVVALNGSVSTDADSNDAYDTVIQSIVFGLTLVASVVASTTMLVNPLQRWRILKCSAVELQSVLWKYRTRVGVFTVSATNPNSAPIALSNHLQRWRQNFADGTTLKTSDMERHFPDWVYTHYQRTGNPKFSLDDDDCYSPVKPEDYVQLRLLRSLHFFKCRIPSLDRRRCMMEFFNISFCVLASVFAYFRLSSYVPIVTALLGAVSSWIHFIDYDRKLTRYTDTVHTLKNLHDWWMSLTGVEQASMNNVRSLVLSTESAIMEECSAWASCLAQTKSLQSEITQNFTADTQEELSHLLRADKQAKVVE